MFMIVIWLALAGFVGWYASGKGRPGFLFFIISLILSPLIGLIIAIVIGPNTAVVEKEALSSGSVIKCPSCAELVKSEAKICKHCQSPLTKSA
ncbi:zinc ribbon domain-containing protein [Ferrimonas aestuarii]|uniref:Zinc ribbon domain-containing protein n=1 Tax=Ferrimonas aestuarii TaxID=2569539 RepID=A0A4U1BSM5_9GAMM|nr:zinc ribbon domain-containing protein [Ferrimonas aestuarii]TKB57603.1 zinc ribbon domain-containing protein [Ferrimonas aestuarii]